MKSALGVAMTLLVVVAGCGVPHYRAVPQEGVKPQPPGPVWTVDFAEGKRQAENDLLATWANDQLVVRGQKNAVTAYRVTTGEIAWRLPSDGLQFCAMSSTTRDGIGVVVFGGPNPHDPEKMLCNQVRAVDLATGTTRWSVESEKPHPSGGGDPVGRNRPEISGDVVVVDTAIDLIGLDLGTGSRRWFFDGVKTNPIGQGPRPGPCVTSSKAVSVSRILIERRCSPEALTIGGPTVITSIDPLTGHKQWDQVMAGNSLPSEPLLWVANAEPPALFVDRSLTKDGPSSVLPLDPATGRPRTELPLPNHPAEYVGDLFERAPRTLAVGNVLVVVIDADYMSECLDAAALYAVDLVTGAVRWSGPAELNCGISVTGVQDTVVTVLAGGSRNEPASLLSVDLRKGDVKRTTIGSWNSEDTRLTPPGDAHVIGEFVVVAPVYATYDRPAVTALAIAE